MVYLHGLTIISGHSGFLYHAPQNPSLPRAGDLAGSPAEIGTGGGEPLVRVVRGQKGPQDGMAIFRAVFATLKRWDLILKVRDSS